MSSPSFPLPVLGFAAWSGAGKTTLLTRILPLLGARGLRVAVIKHAHHDFDIDHPGKDSHTLRKAGAGQMLIASRRRWALMVESEHASDPQLSDLLERLDTTRADLVLVEGFKHEHFPKIEVHRAALGKPLLHPDDSDIIAVVTDTPLQTSLPCLDIDDTAAVAEFVMRHCLQA